MKVDCESCGKSGKVTCVACGGKGTFEVIEIPPPPMEVDPDFIKSQAERARASLEMIAASAKSLKALRGRSDSARARGPELERKVDSLRKEIGEDPALRGEAALLDEKWSGLKRSRELVDERLRNAETKVQAGLETVRRLEEMLLALEGPGKVSPVDGADLSRCEVASEACRAAVSLLEAELEGLERVLQGCSKQLDQSGAAVRERLAKKEQVTREKALIDAAFARFRAAAIECARKAALPEVETALLPSTRSSKNLHSLVVYFDADQPPAAEVEDAVPTDAALENLPRFVTLLFGKVPEAGKIQVTIDGRVIGDTGHEERRAIQTFTMERKRWNELVTGQHKGEWSTLLSKSMPAPPYPRLPRSVLMDGWPLVLLLIVLAFALAVLYVARSRMIS